ncbi:MAG: urease accessory protein UreF [Coraliomargarita sp.]
MPALLQVSDPLFPTGAYAHSMGLEQWATTRGFRSADDLIEFFAHHTGPALQRLELPYLRYAGEALHANDLEQLFELESEIDAWKWASEIREASMAQGRGRLRLLKKLWSGSEHITAYSQAYADGRVRGHHLIVSALQFERLVVPEEAALMTYGYQSLANFVSASVKLLRISPEAAQRALHAGLELLPDWVEQSRAVAREDAGWFAPAFDIACARHATAFSRLFIS